MEKWCAKLTILELGPEQGDRVLPKLERLRQMRQEHILNSERILGERESIAGERTRPLDEGREVRVEPTRVQYPLGEDPIKDRFVAVERDKEEVYASKVEHRSRKLEDAVAFKMADLARMENLTADRFIGRWHKRIGTQGIRQAEEER